MSKTLLPSSLRLQNEFSGADDELETDHRERKSGWLNRHNQKKRRLKSKKRRHGRGGFSAKESIAFTRAERPLHEFIGVRNLKKASRILKGDRNK